MTGLYNVKDFEVTYGIPRVGTGGPFGLFRFEIHDTAELVLVTFTIRIAEVRGHRSSKIKKGLAGKHRIKSFALDTLDPQP